MINNSSNKQTLTQWIKLSPNRALVLFTAVYIVFVPLSFAQEVSSLTLEDAIELAVQNDDWLLISEQEEYAFLEEAIAAGELPDPRIMVGLANMPIDSLRFNQEPMTQFRLGINQSFPRGATRELQSQKISLQSQISPIHRGNRIASVKLEVTSLWLEIYLAEQSISLIESDRDLFEQLVDITSVRYTSAAGLSRQQDLVRAELELVRLDERLATLRQRQDSRRQELAEWLPFEAVSLPFNEELPELLPSEEELTSLNQASELFRNHPIVRANDKQIEIARTQVEITRQSFKPSFSIGASYGYRDRSPLGMDRDDFVSIDLNFDLPIFTKNRQEPRLRASQYRASARQTERILLIKELFARYQGAQAQLEQLDERRSIFNDSLLSQLSDLTEATLSSYTADEGDFEEVMRAYIAELNANIELLQIDVERLKIISILDYLLTNTNQ
ncbi:MAG: TolC family protein [Gammaproteobacteria bacterium]|nr:TolC family protein [Gammaproteobacteria bacterium]